MALPKAVQKQLDEAAAIELQLSGASESQTELESGAEVIPQPVIEAPQAPAQEPHVPDWERKYHVLQGKYDSEVPRLHGDVREMKQTLASLTQQLELAKQIVKQETQPVKSEPLVSEQDKEVFGEDLVNLQERIARAATAPLIETIRQLTDRLGKYEGDVKVAATQQAATAEDRYFERLTASAPDFAEINADPKWLEWLGGRYPGMTTTRQEQLNTARSSLDVNATAEMFSAYRELTPPPKQANQNQELKSQVAPAKSKSSSAAPTPDSSTRIWTAAEVTAALDPRKLRSMTPEQVERVMSDIDAASAENRIKN